MQSPEKPFASCLALMPRKPARADYIILFLLGALWGSSFGAIKVALYGVSPLTVMSVRVILAGVALLVLTLIRSTPLPRGLKNWNKVLWMALFGVLMPFFLVPWGQQKIDSSLAAIIMSINPFFALILGHFFSEDENFSKQQFFAMLVGFAGVFLVFSENADFSSNGNFWGQGAVILAGIGYTISGVIAARVKEISADYVSASVFVVASLIALPFWLIIESPWNLELEMESIIALTHLGFVSTGIAFLMRYYIILRAGAVFFSYVAFIIPMFGIFFGVLFLDEILSLSTMVAVLLILSGVYLGRK